MGMRSVLSIREGILNPQGKTVDYSPLAVRSSIFGYGSLMRSAEIGPAELF